MSTTSSGYGNGFASTLVISATAAAVAAVAAVTIWQTGAPLVRLLLALLV